jgi:hypothetical protein
MDLGFQASHLLLVFGKCMSQSLVVALLLLAQLSEGGAMTITYRRNSRRQIHVFAELYGALLQRTF